MKRSDLLARVFGFNVLACPCGGHRRPIAVITPPDVIPAILAAMVLSNSTSAPAPPFHPRQLTPDMALGPTAAPACGDAPVRDKSPNHTLQHATNLEVTRFTAQDALMTAHKRARRAQTV